MFLNPDQQLTLFMFLSLEITYQNKFKKSDILKWKINNNYKPRFQNCIDHVNINSIS